MNRFAIIVVMSVLCVFSVSFAKDVFYAQEDRDRLIRLETKVEEGLKAVNHRIDGLDKRLDGLQGLMYVVIWAVIAQTVGIVGFVLWDRRSALAPTISRTKELEEEVKALQYRESMVEKVLHKMAGIRPRFQDILKEEGLTSKK